MTALGFQARGWRPTSLACLGVRIAGYMTNLFLPFIWEEIFCGSTFDDYIVCRLYFLLCIYICCSHLLNESPGAITFNAVTLNSTDIFGIKLFISEVICPLLPTVFVVVMLMLLDEGGAPFFFFFFFLAPLPATLFPTSASACVQVLYPCSKTIE